MHKEAVPAQVGSNDQLGPLPEPAYATSTTSGAFDHSQMRAYAAREVAAERERWVGLVAELLDTELGDLAATGSQTPVENILGRMRNALRPN